MASRQARILNDLQTAKLLSELGKRRHPLRNRVIRLLSFKAGLRAAEISKLDWSMVLDPSGTISNTLALEDQIAKKRHGRAIPMHAEPPPSIGGLAKSLQRRWASHSLGARRSDDTGLDLQLFSSPSTRRQAWKDAQATAEDERSSPKRLAQFIALEDRSGTFRFSPGIRVSRPQNATSTTTQTVSVGWYR